MGLRFRKSIKVGKNSRVNISKSGIGFSTGVKGLRFTRTAKGQNKVTASIPGTGISYEKNLSAKGKNGVPFYKTGAFAILVVVVILVLAVVLYLILTGKITPDQIETAKDLLK